MLRSIHTEELRHPDRNKRYVDGQNGSFTMSVKGATHQRYGDGDIECELTFTVSGQFKNVHNGHHE